MTEERKILNMRQIAQKLGINPETARRWAVSHRYPAFRYTDGGRWHAYADDLDNWIATRKDVGESGPADQ